VILPQLLIILVIETKLRTSFLKITLYYENQKIYWREFKIYCGDHKKVV